MWFEKWYDKSWRSRFYRSLGRKESARVNETQSRLEENVRDIGADLADITCSKRWCLEEDDAHTIYADVGIIEELIDVDRAAFLRHVIVLFDEDVRTCLNDKCITNSGIFRFVQEDTDAVIDRLKERGVVRNAEMRDYFFDAIDYQFIVDRDGSLRDMDFCVGLGGPSIYVKTREGIVFGKWGCDVAEHSISESTRDAIRNYGEELYDLVLNWRQSCNY